MSYAKVNQDYLNAALTNVANAIRKKCKTSDTLAFPDDFISKLQELPDFEFPTDTITVLGDVYEIAASDDAWVDVLDDPTYYQNNGLHDRVAEWSSFGDEEYIYTQWESGDVPFDILVNQNNEPQTWNSAFRNGDEFYFVMWSDIFSADEG